MNKYDERRIALQRLRDRLGYGAIRQIADAIGKDPSYVSRMLYPSTKDGRKRIGEDSVDALNLAFPGWMDDVTDTEVVRVSEAQPPAGYVRLEHLSPSPSMGRGATISEPTQIIQYLDVLEQWVRQHVGSANPARIKILTGTGSSMMPTIQDRDLVFVDVQCHTIEGAGIYVLDVAGRFILKKALVLSNGTLIIRSDNVTEYPDEERYDLRHMDDQAITVCGKVLAWWTLRKG